MIEVEAKVKVRDPGALRVKIRKIARYVGKEKKVDDYYTLEKIGRYPKKSLRVRHGKDYHVVNFKERISFKRGVHAKKEVEFKVSDLKGFYELLKNFGFRKWLRKEKDCEIYKIVKNFHIELNKIKGLGWYMEVEFLTTGNIGQARHKIINALKKLGVQRVKIIKKGYTRELWEKR
jgi:predicted adenylyl cyclase CyaB